MEVDQLHRQLTMPGSDHTQIGQVRRAAVALSNQMGLDETTQGKLAIIATEMASNIVKHAGRGEVVLRALRDEGPGIEALAIDRGPGMADPDACLRDGFSTAGSAGTGLGAMSRLSDTFDIYSYPDKGTVVMARVWKSGGPINPSCQVGSICLPMGSEQLPGDAWAVDVEPGRLLVTVIDGLGHGAAAAIAAEKALQIFREHPAETPEQILGKAHEALHDTRGATMAVAEVFMGRQQLEYCGIGNIYGAVVAPSRSRSLVSLNGTVGHELRKLRAFTYPYPAGALLIMHSDGLSTRWSLDDYPGIFQHHPAIAAAVLYRDHSRQRDDVAVFAGRYRP